MKLEIIVTIGIGIFAVVTIYKKTIKRSSAGCGCGHCLPEDK